MYARPNTALGRRSILALSLCFGLSACGSSSSSVSNPVEENEEEVITTVLLRFEPTAGGDAIEAAFVDPDGDGGADPIVDPVLLDAGTEYTLSVSFLNELESPPEDITEEIAEEDDEHQVFFTGSAVEGPATGSDPDAVLVQEYADADADGNPVGLESIVTTRDAGTGELTVTLRHLPPVNGVAVKVDGLAEGVAVGGIGSLPGSSDASVTFAVTVG